MTDYLLTLDDPRCADPRWAGSKAAALARLFQAGFDVPEAVVLTTEAFRIVGRTAGRLPDAVERAIITAAARFDGDSLAARSSSVVEDGTHRSFAGQFDTVLDIHGAEELVAAVQTVWRSTTSDRVAAYEHNAEPAPMAVLIQRLVAAETAGVAFTADPVTGDRTTAVVEVVRGLGDRAAAGEVTPERWTVDARAATRRSGDDMQVLDGAVAARVAEVARAVATHAGAPQDVEWALEGGRVWLLQARPITTLGVPPIEPVPVPIEVPDGYWEREASHAPRPVSPFLRAIWMDMRNRPLRELCADTGSLIEAIEFREVGGWEYIGIVPAGGKSRRPPPGWLLGLLARVVPDLRAKARRAARFVELTRRDHHADRWYREWRPWLDVEIQRLRDVDLTALSDVELDKHVAQTLALLDRSAEIHFRLHFAVGVPLYELSVACRELIGWTDDQTCALLCGLSTTSTEPARALTKLALHAAGNGELRAMVESAGPDAMARIRALDPAFADAFDEYQRRYGCRALRYEVADPTLAEAPEVLLGLIRDQLARDFDPTAVQDEIDRRRAAAHAKAEQALERLVHTDRERFAGALDRARRAYPIREENEFYTVSAPLALIRLAALELGRRLAAQGHVDDRDDVFFLEPAEARRCLAHGGDLRGLVARRKGERAWVEGHPGPGSYGTLPPPPPSLAHTPEALRIVNEAIVWYVDRIVEGERNAVRQSVDGSRVDGIAASPGCYTGPVRVVRGEDEFGKIKAGDVVVCPITSPVWSVVFPSLGALVTDSGGILSHPAIIAREFGIPAVVATGNGTEILFDDQLVTVDGSAGTVEPA